MDHALAEQRRYYERARAAAARRPGLHRAQIAALEAHLALVDRAADAAQLSAALAHGGHATALARAGQLDRYAADFARAVALGDGVSARIARDAIVAFTDEGDAAFVDGYVRIAASGATAPAVAEQAATLVLAAVDLACDPDPVRGQDHRRRATTSWALIRASVPGFGLSWLTAPPVRHALPFTDRAGAALRELVAEALGHPADLDGDAPPAPPPPPPLAPVDAIAHLTLDGWPPAPGFDPQTIVDVMAAIDRGDDEVRHTRVEAIAAVDRRAAIAREQDEPVLAALADDVIDALRATTTGTEIAAWVAWHDAVESLERWWWQLLVQVGLWPAAAALIDPAAARPAAMVAARLLGVDPRRALRAPAIARALRRQILDAGHALDDELPIAGPGASLVAYTRVAAATHAADAIDRAARAGLDPPDFTEAARRFSDEPALLATVDHILDACGAPTGGDGAVTAWGRTLALDDVAPARASFARPRPEALW